MTDVASTDINPVETATELRNAIAAGLYNPDLDFARLAQESKYFAKGFRLVEKDALIGVPHIIVSVTYREGFPRDNDTRPGDYVSVECVVADKATLESAPVRAMLPTAISELTVYPNEPVVYNDSSTGIRRTLTELFAGMGMIDPGKPRKDENPFDRPFQEWADGAIRATEGITVDADGEQFRYVAIRGLRRSDYEWQPANGKPQPATTFYIS